MARAMIRRHLLSWRYELYCLRDDLYRLPHEKARRNAEFISPSNSNFGLISPLRGDSRIISRPTISFISLASAAFRVFADYADADAHILPRDCFADFTKCDTRP